MILSRLHPVFRHLPVETMVHEQQKKYYEAIRKSTKNAESSVFIQFMLGEIARTLKQHISSQNGGVSGGVNGGVNSVLEYIRKHPGCRSNAIAAALNIPPRTVERYLKQLKINDIEFRGAPRNGGYYLKEN